MLLKAIFIAVLIYFAYVAVRNLIHAVRADSMAQPRVHYRRTAYREVPPEWRPSQPEPQPRTSGRPRVEEEVQDAKWTDL